MENVEYVLFALFWVCSNPKKSLEKINNHTCPVWLLDDPGFSVACLVVTVLLSVWAPTGAPSLTESS